MPDFTDLTGKLLIAMPGMTDPRFSSAVVFLCAHSNDGAMGLMINRRSRGVHLSDILKQLSIDRDEGAGDMPVLSGGPVEEERGFVLHSPDYESAISTLQVASGLCMTATMDVMEDIAAGRGPEKAIVMLGYCGWGAGQLESELGLNAWLTCDAPNDLVFSQETDGKWQAALKTLGVTPASLSGFSGRA